MVRGPVDLRYAGDWVLESETSGGQAAPSAKPRRYPDSCKSVVLVERIGRCEARREVKDRILGFDETGLSRVCVPIRSDLRRRG